MPQDQENHLPTLPTRSGPHSEVDELARLRAAIDFLPVGVLLMEGESVASAVVAAVNPAWERIVGPGVLPGARLDAMPPVYLEADPRARIPAAELPSARAIETGQPTEDQEVWLQHPGGEWRVVLTRAAPTRRFGRVTGVAVVVQDLTEQKRLRAEAEEGRRTLEALLQFIPEGIVIADAPDVAIRRVSRYGHELTGWTRELLQGIPGARRAERLDILRADGVTRPGADELPLMRATRRGEIVKGEEFLLRTPGGATVPVLCNAGPIRDEEGAVVGGIIAWRDIAERKGMEAALRASEARFRTLAENAPDLISRFDRGLRYLYANRAAERLSRCSREQLIGRTLAELSLPPDFVAHWEGHLRRVLETGLPDMLELCLDGPQGLCFESKLVPERGEDGTVQSVLAIGREVTGRKRAEEALRRSEQLSRQRAEELQTVLDAVPAAVFISRDRRTRRMVANAYATEMLCVPPGVNVSETAEPGAEAAGRGYRYFKDGREIPPHELPVQLAGEGREVRDFEFDVVYDDGSVRHLFGNASALCDEQGIFGAVGAFVDVTELKRAEQAVREADRRKDEFLAVLSHELRNPLMPIRNGLYILQRAAAGSEQAKRAHATIERQVGHLARLVDDLLDVTRISRGKIQLRRERIDLRELVERVVDDHRATFAANEVELAVALDAVPMWISADPTRVAQVVGNLLNNAAKFTPRGGRVTLTLQAAGGTARLRVADTGIGIAPESLGEVFEPFAQFERTLERTRGGLGLGLALVKGLVEMHGGRVSAVSAGLGRGAEFSVELPLMEQASVAPAAEVGKVAARPAHRVLIIEDNPDGAESLREAIELMGHDVRIARDGPEGLSAAYEFRADVVLCDIGLPGMDGYEVARRMRQDPRLSSATLVAVTGYALPEDCRRAMEAGFSQHLPKPPDLDSLERLLDEAARPPARTACSENPEP